MYLMLYANEKGQVLEHPSISMLGRSGMDWMSPEETEMIPLPKGAALVTIPGYFPVGMDEQESLNCLANDPHAKSKTTLAVAAVLPQGFTRTLLPACVSPDSENTLPLFGYAAVGFRDEQIYVAALKSDEHRKWHPCYYNTEGLPRRIDRMLRKYPNNRILRQLARCSLQYGCYTAQNMFYGRWEAGIPTMTQCNADCIGCISESHMGVDSPQNRLDFIPSLEEIVELSNEHLSQAREGIISFGQGCEGEPSLNAVKISQAIKKIRMQTNNGTINMNSNAGYTEGIKLLSNAGLDALRVTIFSCREKNYNYYHRPKNYTFTDVKDSISYAHEKGVKISLNLLTFPGFTDREDEAEALLNFVKEMRVDMIQLRNLNIDPNYLFKNLNTGGDLLGIADFIQLLKAEMPELIIGSYTRPIR